MDSTPTSSNAGSDLPSPVSWSAPRWRWWIHLVLVAAYPLLIGVVGVGGGPSSQPALSGDSKGLLVVCGVQMAIFALVLGLAWLASRASIDEMLLRWRGGFWPVPLGIGYSVAIRVALGILVVVIGAILVMSGAVTTQSLEQYTIANRPNVEAVVDVSAMRQDPLYYWLTLTLVSFVVAGLREEMWRAAFLGGLRALWPRCFGSRGGQVMAVGVAAVIFGVAHAGQGILAACFAGILGVGLGLIMVFHRSIWPAVIAHGMFDATSLALIPWALEKLQEVQKTLGT